ncbi:hypothetical protein EGM88_06355 [Aureibaculum marinum]|uniref:Curli production assembly/transport component CsgE n=2 Tax=Pseudomonadati TaxID=3379134 RepID=A0A3N4P1D9_9FLAO|nr:CsgE family curli-type amyloid fiber assembly protein [Aureibaculum marinum]RPD98806.1 hypothetical protein EGM88_06355 [Aureibaculum marinum]
MRFSLTILCFFFCLILFGQENHIAVKANLKVDNSEGLIDVEGYAENLEDIFQSDLEYLLLSLKTGKTGNLSKNSQSGKFSLSPKESKKLSTLKINIQPDEEIKLFLYIRKEKLLISKDTLVISNKKERAFNQAEAENYEMIGLVVDDVITKLGKDFYDYFYQKYSSSSLKYPFIIHVNEKPMIGISSEITIVIDDVDIFKTMTNPKQEYLEVMAQQAILAINNYAKQRALFSKRKIRF